MARRGLLARASAAMGRWLLERGGMGAYYRGAQISRLTEDWYARILSADQALKNDLYLLRARSRQLCADDAHASGFIQSLKDNVVGWEPDGIRMQARNRSATGELLKPINQQLEQGFARWGEPGTCTADGYDSWGDVQRMMIGTLATDGEFLARRLPGFGNEFGYALQILDPDLLDPNYNVIAAEGTGNEIRMSVEVDRYSRPVAYWMWAVHPTEPRGPRIRERILADQIVHRFVRLRPGQTRGIPWFTPVLLSMNMLAGYTEAEITQARLAAATGGFFERTGEDAKDYVPPAQASADSATPNRVQMEVEPGLARELPVGLKFTPWDPKHPNGNFAAFQKAILRTIARGLNVSYTTFGNDLEGTSYSSIRAGLFTERDGYRGLQRFLTTRFNTPIYRDVVRYGQLSGAFRLPSYATADWLACKWEYRGWPWVDPLNDIQATEREIRLGVNSRQRVCAERGRDFEEILAELAEEQKLAAAVNVEILGVDAARWGAGPPDNANIADNPETGSSGSGSGGGGAGAINRVAPFLSNGHSNGNGKHA